MRYLAVLFTLFLFGVSEYCYSQSTVFYSHRSGDWRDHQVWERSGFPQAGDVVHIQAGHQVKISHSMDFRSGPITIIVDGELRIDRRKTQLLLACESALKVSNGACINTTGAGHGVGNRQHIYLCGTTAWSSNLGRTCGPFQYGTPLPVELVYFDVKEDDKEIKVTWLTASEINNDYYVVERSLNGENWTPVSTVYVHQSTNEHSNYLVYDHEKFNTIVYYRLKQVDFDGKVTYSSVKSIHEHSDLTHSSSGISIVKAFPSPVASQGGYLSFGISSNRDTDAVLNLMDSMGKIVLSAPIKLKNGLNDSGIRLTSKMTGVYTAFIVVGDKRESHFRVIIY